MQPNFLFRLRRRPPTEALQSAIRRDGPRLSARVSDELCLECKVKRRRSLSLSPVDAPILFSLENKMENGILEWPTLQTRRRRGKVHSGAAVGCKQVRISSVVFFFFASTLTPLSVLSITLHCFSANRFVFGPSRLRRDARPRPAFILRFVDERRDSVAT